MVKNEENYTAYYKALFYPVGIYWLLVAIGFLVSGITFRFYPPYQKWIALGTCAITVTIIIYTLSLTIVCLILKKADIRFLILIILGCIVSLIVGLGLPYDVYDNPQNWISQENIVIGLILIIMILFVTFLRSKYEVCKLLTIAKGEYDATSYVQRTNYH